MNYQKLRELRNQLLHDGTPPLEFGCEVELQIDHISPYIARGRLCGKNDWSDTGDFDHHREKSERLTIQAGWYRGDDYVITNFTPDKYKILGTPVTIAEVLVMLNNMLYMLDGMGNLYKMSMKLSDKLPKFDMSFEPIKFDFTQPLSHESNDKACGEIVTLLSNK